MEDDTTPVCPRSRSLPHRHDARAESELTVITQTLDEDPGTKGADRLNTLRDAFVALAALQAYKETNTEVWPDNREDLVSSLDTLTTYGGDTYR